MLPPVGFVRGRENTRCNNILSTRSLPPILHSPSLISHTTYLSLQHQQILTKLPDTSSHSDKRRSVIVGSLNTATFISYALPPSHLTSSVSSSHSLLLLLPPTSSPSHTSSTITINLLECDHSIGIAHLNAFDDCFLIISENFDPFLIIQPTPVVSSYLPSPSLIP